jgi:hypothetical protein
MADKNDLLFSKTWKANVEKSLFSTNWTPDSETRLYEKLDNGYTLTVSGNHAGKLYKWGYTAFYDGKPHAVYGRKDVDNIVAYRVTDLITIGFFNKGEGPGGPYARFVSEDGKTLTVQTVGRHENGEVYFDVIHYEL